MSTALETTHWQTLKKMMEDAGLTWVSKADAIEKLSKLDGSAQEAPTATDSDHAVGVPEAIIEAPTPKAASKSAPKFDRMQPYGQVSGEVEGAPGACYLQNRLYYNSAGGVVGTV